MFGKLNHEHKQTEKNLSELNMSVSPICHTESGNKYAFISFTDGTHSAEGRIPECKIMNSNGFTEEEIEQLEKYMQENLSQLKKLAAGINVFSALMKET